MLCRKSLPQYRVKVTKEAAPEELLVPKDGFFTFQTFQQIYQQSILKPESVGKT